MNFQGGDVEILFVRYRNGEGFTIATALALKEQRRITLVGVMPTLFEGDEVTVSGSWTTHPKFGEQFKVTAVRRDERMPDTPKGIKQWLVSRLRWVGPVTAQKMIDKFGADLWAVIEEEPSALVAIPGITEERVGELVDTYEICKAELAIRVWLYEIGLNERQADAAMKRWPNPRAVIEDNPYVLMQLPGTKFADADAVAKALGVEDDDPRRCSAAVSEVVYERCRDKGHTYLDRQVTVTLASQLTKSGHQAIIDALTSEMEMLVVSGIVVVDEGRSIAPAHLYNAESKIAARVLECS